MPDKDELLNEVSKMDSDSIRKLIDEIWVLYDEAVFMEGKHMYRMGSGDPHWEGHL
jgi:hypothetical protein